MPCVGDTKNGERAPRKGKKTGAAITGYCDTETALPATASENEASCSDDDDWTEKVENDYDLPNDRITESDCFDLFNDTIMAALEENEGEEADGELERLEDDERRLLKKSLKKRNKNARAGIVVTNRVESWKAEAKKARKGKHRNRERLQMAVISVASDDEQQGTEIDLTKRKMRKKLRAGFALPLAMVARTVGRKEYNEQPKAREEMAKEWNKLRNINGDEGVCAWDEADVREWQDVLSNSKDKSKLHIGSLHELCVEKGSELEAGDPNRKYKGRVVFLGDRVKDGNGHAAIFSELSSSPASMEAGKFCDMWGSLPNHEIWAADGLQAYCQSELGERIRRGSESNPTEGRKSINIYGLGRRIR